MSELTEYDDFEALASSAGGIARLPPEAAGNLIHEQPHRIAVSTQTVHARTVWLLHPIQGELQGILQELQKTCYTSKRIRAVSSAGDSIRIWTFKTLDRKELQDSLRFVTAGEFGQLRE